MYLFDSWIKLVLWWAEYAGLGSYTVYSSYSLGIRENSGKGGMACSYICKVKVNLEAHQLSDPCVFIHLTSIDSRPNLMSSFTLHL